MRTLLPDPPPPAFEELLERRRHRGLDRRDEVWQGVLHMNPVPHSRHAQLQAHLLELLGPLARARGLVALGEFNVGDQDDYRIPDAGLAQRGPGALWNPTAALVVEILSPNDDSWNKLPFYAAHAVDEVVIVDSDKRSVTWFARAGATYRETTGSGLIELTADHLAQRLDWPETSD
jgi:Uma2 family endonuclease